jgi:hypothetical protein
MSGLMNRLHEGGLACVVCIGRRFGWVMGGIAYREI